MTSEDRKVQYKGFRMVESDLIRELVVAFTVVTAVVVVAAALFSSPDPKTFTAKQYANQDPVGFQTSALGFLTGDDPIASYGPPYNHQSGSLQSLGFFSPQSWFGVTIPVNAARDFFIVPLTRMEVLDPTIGPALRTWTNATPTQRASWEKAYASALRRAKVSKGGQVALRSTSAGPLPALMAAYLDLARTGTLESIINQSGRIVQTDFTRALLPFGGSPLEQRAASDKLLGSQWGMMKEPGNYPGAVWLWFYTFLYQIPPYNSAPAGDLMVGLTVGVVTLLLLLVPWIPGLRDIPRWVRIYRLIWRDHYAGRGK